MATELQDSAPPEAGGGGGNGQGQSFNVVPLTSYLSEDELLIIPEVVRVKLFEWSAQVGNSLHNFGQAKDTENARLNNSLSELESQIRTLQNDVLQSSRSLEEAEQKYRASVTKLAEVEEGAQNHQKLAAESQLRADIAVREKDELVLVVNKRNDEIERLTDSVKKISDQLQATTVAKIEALVKVDELTGKEMELEYKEKQLEREKEWVSKQVQLLTDELDKKQAEIINTQREFSIKHLQLSSELSEKNEQIRIAELSLENVKKANEAQEKHIEHLINKLKDSEDIEIKMQENFRQELGAQRKIADLYKESSEEASKKVDELEDAVSSLQELLKQATNKYGELEIKFINACKDYQNEVAQRDEEMTDIKKELQNANKLIENFQSKGLTDEMIHSLSPAAAAATTMLKNTKSLTQIYSEYHDLCNEVIIKKQETAKLNQMVKELLQEIQTQGPELEKEKLKNQKNLEKLEILQNQLDLALLDSSRAKSEAGQLKKTLGAVERENSRLRAQLSDLAMQVRALLKETEVQRGNYSAIASGSSSGPVSSGIAEVPDIESTAQLVVSDRLVTFKNIEELQLQNQRLLAVVRELTESQEKATKEAHENQLQLIRDSFQEAMRELEVLREKRLTQDKLLESACKQRDALSELLKQQKSPVKVADPGASLKLAEIQRQFEVLERAHKSLQEEYDTYKKERGEHEKLAVEQTEKLRDDLMRLRTDNAKLASQVDYNNERAKIYNANLETYKKNINVLEERNKKYSATTLKLEQSLDLLKAELSTSQQKLARTEVALNSMTQERNSVRDTNARLQAERDILKRDQYTQQMLRINLQEIKNGVELSNSAIKSKLESEIESLQKENAILRRKVSTETERFKEAVFSWESANKELIEKLRNDQDSLQTTKEQLEDSKATIAKLKGEIEDLQSQVKVLSETTIGTVSASADQPITIPALERQIKELQTQLREAKIENETMAQHLSVARQSAEEYRTLCASIEGQISIVSDTSKQLTEELQQRLEGKDDIIRDLQTKLNSAEREYALIKDAKDALARDLETQSLSLQEEINRMRRDLQSANSKLQSAYEENVRIKMDLEKQTLVYKDIQDKYEKELAAHGEDVHTMNELKNELEVVKLRVNEEGQARRNAENQLTQAEANWESKESSLKNDLLRIQESKNELETLNASLQDQIINLTTRVEASNKSQSAQEDGSNAAAAAAAETAEMESQQKTSEQWLQLIRYLRREKEIARTKTEMAEATCSRYESQIKHLEKQADDLRKEMAALQDSSHVSIITSAKQADLLRKVETLSALTDSNRMLREEKDNVVKELNGLKEHFSGIEAEIGPLREKSSELESRCEGLLNENTALKQEVTRWRARASALLEKSNKINPEEIKRLQTENDNLLKQVQSVQETGKKQQMELNRHVQQVKQLQQQLAALQQSNQSLQSEKKVLQEQEKRAIEEKDKLRMEAQGLRLEVSSLKNSQVEKDDTVERLHAELENINKLLEEQKNTVKAVKGIARKYKKQYEDLQKACKCGGAAGSGSQADGAAEAAANINENLEALKEENTRFETQVKQLQEEIETLKKESETVKADKGQTDERLKNALKSMREKLATTTTQKAEVEAQLNEARARVSTLETSSEENSSRLAALKSQYEGRIGRLEKENRDLKAATENASGDPSEVIAALQQTNEEQKKELDMLRQRLAAVENRYKLQSQTTKVVSPEKVMPVEKAKANIRPIPGTLPKQGPLTRPPLTASIRPMSMTRKATVTVSAMPTQTNQQASSSNIQSTVSAAVVAPVSQAQVSTSTPDQSSSSAPESSPQQPLHQLAMNVPGSSNATISQIRQAAAVQPTVTVAPVVTVGSASAGIVAGSNISAAPASSGTAASASLSGTTLAGNVGSQSQQSTASASTAPTIGIVGSNNDSQTGHQDPSTSSGAQMLEEESEMGDSSEQVSSSEGSIHQNILSVAPLRSKQHEVQQSSSSSTTTTTLQPQPGPSKKQGSSSTEEPSPSSSSLRPSQSSNKRLRGNDDAHQSHHHDEEEDLLSEPDTKRTRVMGSNSEAEALGQQESSNDQILEEDEEEEEDEREADQGSSSALDDVQIQQRSDTTTMKVAGRSHDDDDDSDVIVIESDDEDAGGRSGVTSKATTSRANKSMPTEDEEVEDIDEEEEAVEDEEVDEEEDLMEDDDDVDDDDDDDHGDGGEKEKSGEMDMDYDEMEGQEGREAESLEHDDDDINEVHDVHDDSRDILDSNDSNLDPVDFSGQDQGSQQHELREAEQSIDDEGDDEREDSISAAPVPTVSGSPIRPPRDLGVVARQGVGSPMRALPSGRGGIPPMLGRQQMLTPSFSSHHQYAAEDVDDSIVPGTPTLYVPRRSDGFAEAVSSPQIQPAGRFTFSGVAASANEGTNSSGTHIGSNASSSGGSGLDDSRLNRIDFLSYDEGESGTTGRSVPSTPLQVSPPVEGVELSHEIQADEEAAVEEQGASVVVVGDVQPTSSSIASVSGSDVPAITVTSAMESTSGMSFQATLEGASKGSLEAARLSAMSSQPRTSTHSDVSNVTSSDEDKVPAVAGTSSQQVHIQHPSTSTSSRAASPTPSSNVSNPPTEQREPVPQPQQQQQQPHHQVGRPRPTPIVWDQPSSSSSLNPTSRPIRGGMMGGRGGTMTVRHMTQPDQGLIMPPMMRGGYRPMLMMRGQSQSARRSRPHNRGGSAGGPGLSGPGAGGNIGGRMPFQKPY